MFPWQNALRRQSRVPRGHSAIDSSSSFASFPLCNDAFKLKCCVDRLNPQAEAANDGNRPTADDREQTLIRFNKYELPVPERPMPAALGLAAE